jgi:hypothetical protein
MKLLTAVLAAAAAFGFAGPAGAASMGFADPVGDSPLTPDIATVTVDNDSAGVTFRVAIANRESLGPDDSVAITIDADDDSMTGNRNGWDHVVAIDAEGALLGRWTGQRFDEAADAQITYTYEPNVGFTVVLPRSALRQTVRFRFYVRAWGAADEPFDDAPDGDNVWTYSLGLPFGLTVMPDGPFDLGVEQPRAGKPFFLAMRVRRDDTGETLSEGRIACAATLGGKRLPAKKGRFFTIIVIGGTNRSQAICDWKFARSARGKRLSATISVTFQGVTVRRSYAGVVR